MIELERTESPDVRDLLAKSDSYAASLYPSESIHMLTAKELDRPNVRFLVARLDGHAVGCGALLLQGDACAEIKRMFVNGPFRGLGLGSALLRRIEGIAHDEGVRLIHLETGIRQPEAIRLYRQFGYVECGPFGLYRPDPLSVFMRKPLGPVREP